MENPPSRDWDGVWDQALKKKKSDGKVVKLSEALVVMIFGTLYNSLEKMS